LWGRLLLLVLVLVLVLRRTMQLFS